MPSKAWLFLVRLMYSGRDYAWIYESRDQSAVSTAQQTVGAVNGKPKETQHCAGICDRRRRSNGDGRENGDDGSCCARRRSHEQCSNGR